ncbi:hypothetical protein [Corynebacterium stationis]|uniref:hypothetical protein n=1 Tax=Corynebacterium stationis TaxID=1705 RepID=UPI0028A59DA2|nr:hypothetical protein [Corynebacterium stationis]
MAITSEIIGKLGGADVEVTPASATVTGDGNSQILHTVNIPTGETWLVAVVGTGESTSSTAIYLPRINIGGKRVPQSTGYFASAAVMTKSGDVIFESNLYTTSSFTGHVYTVKL